MDKKVFYLDEERVDVNLVRERSATCEVRVVNDGNEIEHSPLAISILFGDVRSSYEGSLIGCHDNRERPSSTTSHHLSNFHVHLVDIWPLLSIYLRCESTYYIDAILPSAFFLTHAFLRFF